MKPLKFSSSSSIGYCTKHLSLSIPRRELRHNKYTKFFTWLIFAMLGHFFVIRITNGPIIQKQHTTYINKLKKHYRHILEKRLLKFWSQNLVSHFKSSLLILPICTSPKRNMSKKLHKKKSINIECCPNCEKCKPKSIIWK